MFSPLKCFCKSNILIQLRQGLQNTVKRSILCGNNDQVILSRKIYSTVDDSRRKTNAVKQYSTSLATKGDETSSLSTEVLEIIDSKIQARDLGRLFAVVHIDGHQRKVTTEDIIVLHKHIEADIGERIRLNKVLLVGGKDFSVIGRPVLSPNFVNVEASVLEKTLSHTIISSWYRKRKDVRKLYLRKLKLTLLRINKIELSPNKGY